MQKQVLPLSAITTAIEDAIDSYFDGSIITVKAEITDVKKYPHKKWCFLKFLEKNGDVIKTEVRGVFWNTGYGSIAKFEQQTGQKFSDGLEIICDVSVKYHAKFGLSLEVLDIDTAHAIGSIALERQRTIDRLIERSPFVRLHQEEIITFNHSLELPNVVQHIALIAPPNSDGLRDFIQEIQQNAYGYAYKIAIYETQVQGDAAPKELLKAIQQIIAQHQKYQALAIVRGGGSNTDFKPFDDYDVCEAIAGCPIPIFTGIGHDRNTSIADMMARQLKTPTKVADYFVEHNMQFEEKLDKVYSNILFYAQKKIGRLKEELKYIDKTLQQLHPQNVLNKGYAVIKQNKTIVDCVTALKAGDAITIQTKEHNITATITNIEKI
jgi:exodeoxyribonuclease VII large subunit